MVVLSNGTTPGIHLPDSERGDGADPDSEMEVYDGEHQQSEGIESIR